MLLKFAVENFKSYKNKIEFKMLATNYREHPEHVISVDNNRVLKTAAIYGYNSSEKVI